ncbi:MAG: TRAP transporter large permease [Geminicoccaceae bacterium]
MTIAVLFLIFGVLVVLQVPIAFAMGASGAVYLLLDGLFAPTVMVQRMAPGLHSFPLLAIPLFILAGHLLNHAGIAGRIFAFASTLVGHIRGGLAHVNVVASIIFAGMSGVAAADAAGLGAIEVKAMRKAGFTAPFSAAITAASAIIGPIVPPSVIMVLYAVMARVSIGDMFLAGILPGLVMGLLLMAMVYWLALTGRIQAPVSKRASLPSLWTAFVRALPALLAPVGLVGGLLLGVATPTELGALVCIYALLLGAIYRQFTLGRLLAAFSETVTSCGVILLLVAVGVPFGWIVAIKNLPQLFSETLVSISADPLVILLLINLGLLIAGAVMETAAILLIAVPMLYPLMQVMQIDPIHFGIVVVLNLVIGVTTPPFGMILFIMMDVAKVRMGELVRAMLPFYIPLFAVLALVILFPDFTLFVPRLFGY